MSKRRKEHFIEGWCKRRFHELETVNYDLDELAKRCDYENRMSEVARKHGSNDSSKLDILAYYSAAFDFYKAGKQIYLLDDSAKKAIEKTNADKTAWDAAYDYLPFNCIFIELKNETHAYGIFVKRNVEMHEMQYLPIPKGGDYLFDYQETTRFKNIAAYISCKNADIKTVYKPSGNEKHPNKRRSEATWHEVGYRIGAELRAYERMASERKPHQGGTVRPHMRRAHWHHFWTGPRDGERKLVLKWVPPTMVALKNGPIQGATGHRVPVTDNAE